MYGSKRVVLSVASLADIFLFNNGVKVEREYINFCHLYPFFFPAALRYTVYKISLRFKEYECCVFRINS